MRFEVVQWDDGNLEHITDATPSEIEQVIGNADRMSPHRQIPDRRVIRGRTDGGRPLLVIVQLLDGGRTVRPITTWEDR